MHLLWWIIVGLVAGWATGKIMRGSGYGPLMDIVIGIIGAVIGGWIMNSFGRAGPISAGPHNPPPRSLQETNR